MSIIVIEAARIGRSEARLREAEARRGGPSTPGLRPCARDERE
jgi:hypothetical protein